MTNNNLSERTKELYEKYNKWYFDCLATLRPSERGICFAANGTLHEDDNIKKNKTFNHKSIPRVQATFGEADRVFRELKRARLYTERMVLLLMAYLDLEIEAVLDLAIEEEDLGIYMRAKARGRRFHQRKLSDELSNELKEYIKYTEKDRGDSRYIFINKHGNKLKRPTFWSRFKKRVLPIIHDYGCMERKYKVVPHSFKGSGLRTNGSVCLNSKERI